jgi:hypothetical protein
MKLKRVFTGLLDFFYDLLDLNKRTDHREVREETNTADNQDFQTLFIIILLYVLLLILGTSG